MRFTYDPESGALYMRMVEGEISETLELGGGCYLDVAGDGTVMGLECLSLDEFRELIERSGGELNLPQRVDEPGNIETTGTQYDTHSLRRALNSLDQQKQDALRLQFVEGLALEEVAARLGLSLAATHRLLRAGIQELKETMRESDAEPEDEVSIEAALSTLQAG